MAKITLEMQVLEFGRYFARDRVCPGEGEGLRLTALGRGCILPLPRGTMKASALGGLLDRRVRVTIEVIDEPERGDG